MTTRVPVAPASHYVMGGIVTDLDGRHGRRPGCTPSASAPAPACTAPTGSRRTRSASASCSAAAPRSRASTSRSPRRGADDRRATIAPPTPETRAAVWRLAGLERRRASGSPSCDDDPHPLARLVAASALAREETRGAHGRAEFPDPDPALDRMPHASSIPTPRPRASRHGRTPDRLGRRPDDEHDGLVRRLQPARGTRRARGPAAPSATGPEARQALIDLESGDIAAGGVRSAASPRALERRRRRPRPAPDRRRAPGRRRCSTPSGATTTPAYAPRSSRTRGRATDYDETSTAVRRRRALPGARDPQARPERIYTIALERLGLPAERCVFVDDLGGNLKPAKALGMTTIRHESAGNDPPRTRPPSASRSFLTRSQQRRRFEFSRVRQTLSHRATEGTRRRRGQSRGDIDVPLQSFHLSRACSGHHRGSSGARRDYEPRARPALVRDLRRAARHGLALLRQADQDAVQRHPDLLPDVGAAARLQDRRPLHVLRARVLRGEPGRRAARVPRDDAPRDTVPADAAAAQRVLPVAPAPGRDRATRRLAA